MANQYWEKREKDNIKALLKQDADYSKQMQDHYNETLKGINDQINEFYVKYSNKEGISLSDAKKAVANEDVQAFADTAKKMTKAKDFSPEANEKLRLYNATMKINRLEMLKSQIGTELTKMNNTQANKLTGKLTSEYKQEVKRQAGILGSDKVDNVADKADMVVKGSFNNATFSQRIWSNQDALKGRIDSLLTSWLIRGDKPTDRLAKDLSKEMGVNFSLADRLMKTESSRISFEAEKRSLDAAGVEYFWVVGEPSACDICKDIIRKSHSNPIKVKDAVVGDNIPPIHPRCRCTMSAAANDEDEWNQWLDDNGLPTSESFKKQPKNNVTDLFSKDAQAKMGTDNYKKMLDSFNANPDSSTKKMFNKFGNEIDFAPVTSETAKGFANGKTVHLSQKSFDGRAGKQPLDTVYHEVGHGLDYLGLNKITGKNSFEVGTHTERVRIGRKMVNVEVNDYVTHISGLPKYNLKQAIDDDFWHAANPELKTIDSLGPKPSKRSEATEWRKEYYDIQERSQLGFAKLKQELHEKQKNNPTAYSSLSDIMEGSGYFGLSPLEWGHGSNYWKNIGNRETEFFAEASASKMADPSALKVLQEILPTAMKKYEQIVKDITEAK